MKYTAELRQVPLSVKAAIVCTTLSGHRVSVARSGEDAQASGMKAHRARRQRWLDAQHDSTTRHRRGTHENP